MTENNKKVIQAIWFWLKVMSAIIGIFAGLIFLGQFFGILPDTL